MDTCVHTGSLVRHSGLFLFKEREGSCSSQGHEGHPEGVQREGEVNITRIYCIRVSNAGRGNKSTLSAMRFVMLPSKADMFTSLLQQARLC